MRVIFMGTPDFAVGTLEAIIEAGHEVVLAVTQPDKPKGRSASLQFPPVKECAIAHNIPVFQPVKIREQKNIDELKKYDPDIIIVVAFGQIVSKEILDMPRYGCVNVHASLLPKYRGAAPIQWAVINGDEITGVTTQRMDVGVDTGDIIETAQLRIAEDETGGSLFDKLAMVGAKLCVSTMEKIEKGEATYTPQKEEEATHTKKIEKELGNVDWSKSAKEIECLIRGLNPWPSAYTHLNGKNLKLWQARVVDENSALKPGTIAKVTKDEILVQTGAGMLSLLEVQLEGKKRMPVDAFLRGYPLEEKTVFE
ncbi:MAG: methionyl-tRNA formyltransferase [Agathobacter sp.]